jgi:hypothetical protein
MREERVILEDVGDVAPVSGDVRAAVVERATGYEHAPVVGPHETGDDPQ